MPSISGRIRKTLDPCVVLMKQLVRQYAAGWVHKGGIYSLAQGVVYWEPPYQAFSAMRRALDDDDDEKPELHMYGPDEGLLSLRQALQDKISNENGLQNHSIMVTVGANQAYMNCVLTLLEHHHKAVVFAPYYFNHVMALQMALPESSLLVGPTAVNGLPDLQWLKSSLLQDPDIQVVTICNPGNPTGITLPREFVQEAVDLCRKHKCWLVLDTTYEYFCHDSEFDSCFADAHVIHIFSFSKAYALAGYRCGYLTISNEAVDLFDQMLKVQDTIPIAPPRISQIAALGALDAGREWVQAKVETLEKGKAAILQALAPLEQIMGGSGAMYVMGKLHAGIDDIECANCLVRDFGVAVIPGSYCGYPGWIRVCYANLPPDDCLLAAERLAAGLRHICQAA
jgi:aromatic aminotransferase